MIANTSASVLLLFSSLMGYPCSCTYMIIRKTKKTNPIIIANIYVLSRLHRGKELFDDKGRVMMIALFFCLIIILSATLSVILYEFINYLSIFKTSTTTTM